MKSLLYFCNFTFLYVEHLVLNMNFFKKKNEKVKSRVLKIQNTVSNFDKYLAPMWKIPSNGSGEGVVIHHKMQTMT